MLDRKMTPASHEKLICCCCYADLFCLDFRCSAGIKISRYIPCTEPMSMYACLTVLNLFNHQV